MRTTRLSIALLLLLSLATSLRAQPRESLTVAAYNIENLFDIFDDPYTADEGTRVKPRKELESIAALIRKLNTDVIAFSEVENENVLKAFITEMLPDLGYKHVAAASSNDTRGIRTAIASRLPIKSITSYRFLELKLEGEERTWKFARDLMHVQLEVSQNRTLHAFAVHLKSMRDDGEDKKSAKWRAAETAMARKIIDGVQAKEPGAWVVMLGDFNSYADTPPMRQLLDAKPGNDAGAGPPLVDLHAHISAENLGNITYLKQGPRGEEYRTRIDYILASDPLAKRVTKDSAKIFNNKEELGELLSGSDHAPVVVTFDVKE